MAPEQKQELGAEWARVRGQLRQEFGEDAFKSWLKPLTFAGVSEGEVRITAPTRFLRDWIATHYADRIHALWSAENPAIRGIVIQVDAVVTVPTRHEFQLGFHLATLYHIAQLFTQ